MNKTVLITGASRGIGAAAARLFAKEDYHVIINYRKSKAEAEKLAAETGAEIFCADVRDRSQVDAMFSACGGVDILINNAGISRFGLFSDLTSAEWHEMLDTTLTGAYHCIQAALPHMIHQKDGRILNISSIWGITGASCETAYSTAKAGLIGMTRALAKELGPSGIRVNCVAPGVIDTDMNAHLTKETLASLQEETPLGTIGTPEDVARLLLFLAGRGGDFITGQVISPNGGFVI